VPAARGTSGTAAPASAPSGPPRPPRAPPAVNPTQGDQETDEAGFQVSHATLRRCRRWPVSRGVRHGYAAVVCCIDEWACRFLWHGTREPRARREQWQLAMQGEHVREQDSGIDCGNERRHESGQYLGQATELVRRRVAHAQSSGG
jgi:hypothetical protein